MHLSDCFIELVAYVAYFLKTVETRQAPYDQVKADVLRLLTQSESCLKKNLFPAEDYDLARFAICAWVDESILQSAWNQKTRWQREQLQRLYYQTTDAGELFFERLNSLGFHQRDVREVYYICLALGFKGRFIHAGDEYLLGQVKSSNLKLLIGSSVGIPSLERADLFPEAYPVESTGVGYSKTRRQFSIVTLACLLGPVVFFVLLYLIYRFALSGIAENFLRAVS